MKKVFFALLSLILLIILFLVMMLLLGYKFNKNFINFNREKRETCIEREYPTYYHHSGIAGCIFWMRHDYLERTQSWRTMFKRDDAYCDQKYKKKEESGIRESFFSGERVDPKCDYDAFQEQKRNENWDYLISKERDGFYDYCVNQSCPRQTLFK